MSGHVFDVYQDGTDLAEALRKAVADARRRRNGHGPAKGGIAQKNSAVPVQDEPVTHMRAISIARDLVSNHLDKVGDQFSNWCGAIPVCDEDGVHIGWVFAGLFHQ